MLTFTAHHEADTDRLAGALARAFGERAVVSLVGTLGAGKTRLVQGVAAACGVPVEDVVSPTFTLCQEYHGSRTIFHLDAYRLKDDDEFLELGVQELFDSPALVFIEWGDRVAACLPEEHATITIEVTGESARTFTIAAAEETLERLRRELAPASANGPTG